MHFLGQSHEVPGEGEFVVAVVEEQGAAAADLGVEAPGPGGERHVPGGRAEAGVALDANGERVADLAGVDQGLGARYGRVEDEVFVDPQGLFGGSCGRDHLVGFGQGERHRLLDGDVLAGGERVQGHGMVEVMGQQDLDQVEVGQGKQVVVVVEDAGGRHAPLACPPLGALVVDIADGYYPGAFALEIFEGVQVADAACSDDPYAQHTKAIAPRLSSCRPRRSGS